MSERKNILSELVPSACPEAYEFLSTHDIEAMPPYALASALVECDDALPMPKALFGFIRGLYLEAAAEGESAALNDLGTLYYCGRGCERDYKKAIEYYEAAARQGSAQALENLGYCYYYGRDVPVDYEKAFRCFIPGALEGRPAPLYKIGDMYRNGYFVEKDPEEAYRLYTRCLDLMTDAFAPRAAGPVYLRVGECLLAGEGTDADPKKALLAFQRAELFLYDMVSGGDDLYEESLRAAVEGQAAAREKLAAGIPKQMFDLNLQ